MLKLSKNTKHTNFKMFFSKKLQKFVTFFIFIPFKLFFQFIFYKKGISLFFTAD